MGRSRKNPTLGRNFPTPIFRFSYPKLAVLPIRECRSLASIGSNCWWGDPEASRFRALRRHSRLSLLLCRLFYATALAWRRNPGDLPGGRCPADQPTIPPPPGVHDTSDFAQVRRIDVLDDIGSNAEVSRMPGSVKRPHNYDSLITNAVTPILSVTAITTGPIPRSPTPSVRVIWPPASTTVTAALRQS